MPEDNSSGDIRNQSLSDSESWNEDWDEDENFPCCSLFCSTLLNSVDECCDFDKANYGFDLRNYVKKVRFILNLPIFGLLILRDLEERAWLGIPAVDIYQNVHFFPPHLCCAAATHSHV
jgi:hypothetical protein